MPCHSVEFLQMETDSAIASNQEYRRFRARCGGTYCITRPEAERAEIARSEIAAWPGCPVKWFAPRRHFAAINDYGCIRRDRIEHGFSSMMRVEPPTAADSFFLFKWVHCMCFCKGGAPVCQFGPRLVRCELSKQFECFGGVGYKSKFYGCHPPDLARLNIDLQ